MLVGRRAVFITGMRKLVHTDFCHVAESGSARQMQNVVFDLQLAIPMGHMCIGHCVFVSSFHPRRPTGVNIPDVQKNPHIKKSIP